MKPTLEIAVFCVGILTIYYDIDDTSVLKNNIVI